MYGNIILKFSFHVLAKNVIFDNIADLCASKADVQLNHTLSCTTNQV